MAPAPDHWLAVWLWAAPWPLWASLPLYLIFWAARPAPHALMTAKAPLCSKTRYVFKHLVGPRL